MVTVGAAWAQQIPAPTILCVTTNEQNGDVDITWTQPTLDPCGPFVEYVIEGSLSATGPWNIVATIGTYGTTNFTHVGANATVVDWYYRAYMRQNCPGSTPDTSAIKTEEVLFAPDINYVTVLPDGTVEINWTQSPNSAPQGFVVLSIDTGTGLGNRIDTVPGSTATTYIDGTNDPTSYSVTYYVNAFDACGTETAPLNPNHSTIFLDASINTCAQNVVMGFNPYVSWPGDTVERYELEVFVDGTSADVVDLGNNYAATPAGVRYQYIYDIAALTGDSVTFVITAFHPNGTFTSASNRVGFRLNALRSTAFNIISNVTVNEDGTVELSWLADTTADLSYFIIKRGTDTSNLQPIDTVPVSLGSISFDWNYTDITANGIENGYFYQVESADTCGFNLNSNIAQTILLVGEFNGGTGNNDLYWNIFDLNNITLINTTIYRLVDGLYVPIETILPTIDSLNDPVSSAISNNGTFCYRVETEYQLTLPGLGLNRSYSSYSATICIDLPPTIYIPNAFVPGGSMNDVFKPVLLFPVDQYEFYIYDRWGKEIFATENIIAGWDGTRNGEKLATGGYVYYVRAVSTAGRVVERKGVVALLR